MIADLTRADRKTQRKFKKGGKSRASGPLMYIHITWEVVVGRL